MNKFFFFLCGLIFFLGSVQAGVVTLTSPVGGEYWRWGSIQTVSFSLSETRASPLMVMLYKEGTLVGGIFAFSDPSIRTYPPGNYNCSWEVGKVSLPTSGTFYAPAGTGYTIRVTSQIGAVFGESGPFSIVLMLNYDFTKGLRYRPVHLPGDCPTCIHLELSLLGNELAKYPEPVEVTLFYNGRQAASLGSVGKGKGFVENQPVPFTPDAFAATKQGSAQFELRISAVQGKLLFSKPVVLSASSR